MSETKFGINLPLKITDEISIRDYTTESTNTLRDGIDIFRPVEEHKKAYCVVHKSYNEVAPAVELGCYSSLETGVLVRFSYRSKVFDDKESAELFIRDNKLSDKGFVVARALALSELPITAIYKGLQVISAKHCKPLYMNGSVNEVYFRRAGFVKYTIVKNHPTMEDAIDHDESDVAVRWLMFTSDDKTTESLGWLYWYDAVLVI